MKKRLISMTPKQFLLTLLPMVIVAIFICIAFSAVTNALIERNVIDRSRASVDEVDLECEAFFAEKKSGLAFISNKIKESDNPDEIRKLLDFFAGQQQDTAYFYGSAEYLSDGSNLLISEGEEIDSSDPTSLPWYTEALESEYEYAGSVYQRDGDHRIALSTPVYSSDGTLLGVAGFDTLLSTFANACSGILISANSLIEITLPSGLYLTNNSTFDTIFLENYFSFSKVSSKYSLEDYFDGIEKFQIIGDYYYAIKQFTNYPWFIVSEGPLSDFTGDFNKWFFIIISITVVLIAGCIILNAYSMNKMKATERILGDKLYGETQNLAVAAKENAATSQDQSTAVKEIVATMEDNNSLSESISTKIMDVSSVANKTFADVNDGVKSLEVNVTKLHEIFEANENTISGIKALSDKIGNIWDIVTLINSVADQAKIIAFNAELEASSAGEAGKNFHIVATEIRRLADGIIDGTKEIKERINEIQQSSDSLILASESGTEKINEGCESVKELEEKFNSIKSASEITADSAEDITSIIQQQTIASQQVLITLKQISSGVENFSQATENISNAAQNVQAIAEQLNEKNEVETDK